MNDSIKLALAEIERAVAVIRRECADQNRKFAVELSRCGRRVTVHRLPWRPSSEPGRLIKINTGSVLRDSTGNAVRVVFDSAHAARSVLQWLERVACERDWESAITEGVRLLDRRAGFESIASLSSKHGWRDR